VHREKNRDHRDQRNDPLPASPKMKNHFGGGEKQRPLVLLLPHFRFLKMGEAGRGFI
jgi:hypothetical protein